MVSAYVSRSHCIFVSMRDVRTKSIRPDGLIVTQMFCMPTVFSACLRQTCVLECVGRKLMHMAVHCMWCVLQASLNMQD